jgi:hypothetical protein
VVAVAVAAAVAVAVGEAEGAPALEASLRVSILAEVVISSRQSHRPRFASLPVVNYACVFHFISPLPFIKEKLSLISTIFAQPYYIAMELSLSVLSIFFHCKLYIFYS